MRLAIQQTLLPGDSLTEKFQYAAEYGFAGVELAAWGFPRPIFEYRAEIEAAMRASGLPISTFCPSDGNDFVHPDPVERKKRLKGLVRMLKLADAVGAQGVIALPIRPPLHLPDLSPVANERDLITQLSVATLKDALDKTAEGQAAIVLEPLNRYEAYYLRTVAQAAELCRAVAHPRVRVMADMFHMNIEEVSIPDALRAEASCLGHIHLADSNRLLPGYGHIDFVATFRVLREIGFEGWLALECNVPGDPTQMLPETVKFLTACWEKSA
jgi:sugar phosphate isomerase/epimerase